MSDRGGAAVAGEVLLIPVDQIDPDEGGRIGLYYPLKAEGLAHRIEEDGQLEPIIVAKAGPRAKQPYRLVAGLHRLRACEMLRRPVEARIAKGSAEELKLKQAAENIDRRKMTAVETTMFVAAVAEAAQRRLKERLGGKSQQQHAIERRWAVREVNLTQRIEEGQIVGDTQTPQSPDRATAIMAAADSEAATTSAALGQVYGWRQDVAEACGLGIEKVKRALRIYRGLVEPHRELIKRIQDHPVADNESALLNLAGKPAPYREKVLAYLAEHPETPTADAAAAELGLAPSKGNRSKPTDEIEEAREKAKATLRSMGAGEWRSWAPILAETIKPKALPAVRDAIEARIAQLRAQGKLEDE